MDKIICEQCGDEMYFVGMVSEGDGDMSDEYMCPVCGHRQAENTIWLDSDGDVYASEHEMWEAEVAGAPMIVFEEHITVGSRIYDVRILDYPEEEVLQVEVRPVKYTVEPPPVDEIPW